MSDHLKQLEEKVTQEVFDRLPALLTAYQVKTITGFNDRELAEAVREGSVVSYRRPVRKNCKRSYSKYTKMSVGRIVGFRV